MNKEQIIEAIKNMTVLELNELVKACEEEFGVSAAAIAVSLKKLEKGGYILRLMDKEDNRVNQVSITEKGKEVIHKSIRIFQETDQAFFEGFQEEEIRQLLGYMERVYANMEALNQKAEKEKGKWKKKCRLSAS